MIWQLGYSASDPDVQSGLLLLYGPAAGGQNLARFRNARFDELYREMQALPDGPERLALLREAQKIVTAYAPHEVQRAPRPHRPRPALAQRLPPAAVRQPVLAVRRRRPGAPAEGALSACAGAPGSGRRRPGSRCRPRRPCLRRRAPRPPTPCAWRFETAETGFDPLAIGDENSNRVVACIFESPLCYDHVARPVKLRPLTATALPEIGDDFRSFTFRIRPGIFFADDPAFKGRPRELVAQDYVYSLKRFYDPRNNSENLYVFENAGILGPARAARARR